MSDARRHHPHWWHVPSTDGYPVTAANQFGIKPSDDGSSLEYSFNGSAWASLGAGGGSKWNAITAPDGDQSLAMGGYTSTWTWATTTAGNPNLVIQDSTTDNGGALVLIRTGVNSQKAPLGVYAKTLPALVVDVSGRVGVGLDTSLSGRFHVEHETTDITDRGIYVNTTLTGSDSEGALSSFNQISFTDENTVTSAVGGRAALIVRHDRASALTATDLHIGHGVVADMLYSAGSGTFDGPLTAFKSQFTVTTGGTLATAIGFYAQAPGAFDDVTAAYGFIAESGLKSGFGTTLPTATLHVAGSARFDLGSDATGDTWYRAATTGLVTRVSTSGASAGWVYTLAGTPLVPIWAASSGSAKWNAIANPDGNQSLTMGAHTTSWAFTDTSTSGGVSHFRSALNYTPTATSTSTPIHFQLELHVDPTTVAAGGATNLFLATDSSGAGNRSSLTAFNNTVTAAGAGTISIGYANRTTWVQVNGTTTGVALYDADYLLQEGIPADDPQITLLYGYRFAGGTILDGAVTTSYAFYAGASSATNAYCFVAPAGSGPLVVGATSTANTLAHVYSTMAVPAASAWNYAIRGEVAWTPTGTITGPKVRVIDAAFTTANATSDIDEINGISSTITITHAVDVGVIAGAHIGISYAGGTSSTSGMYGMLMDVGVGANKTIGEMVGVRCSVNGGFGGTTVTNAYGLWFDCTPAFAAITNWYGLYLDISGSGITNAYGVVVTNDGGKSGFGITAPTAQVHVVSPAVGTVGMIVSTFASGTADAVRIQHNGTTRVKFAAVAAGAINSVFSDAALSTSATDGFIYAPSCAGAPSGTPTTYTGTIATIVDSTNSRFYAYISGAWVNLTGSGATVAGSNTQIQFNNSSALGASADFTWNDSTKVLTVAGKASVTAGADGAVRVNDAAGANVNLALEATAGVLVGPELYFYKAGVAGANINNTADTLGATWYYGKVGGSYSLLAYVLVTRQASVDIYSIAAGAIALTAATITVSGTISFPDGIRQTFNPNGTNAGLNVGSHTADPSSLTNGDLWYDSTANALEARINGVTVALGAGGSPGGSGTEIQVRGGASTFSPVTGSSASGADVTWGGIQTQTLTNTSTSGTLSYYDQNLTISAASNSSANHHLLDIGIVWGTAVNTGATRLRYASITHGQAGTVTSFYADEIEYFNTAGVTTTVGGNKFTYSAQAGTTVQAVGHQATLNAAGGTLTNAIGFYSTFDQSTGTLSTVTGFRMFVSGTIGTTYGIILPASFNGIGVATPTHALDIVDAINTVIVQVDSTAHRFQVRSGSLQHQASSTTDNPVINFYRTRGTLASPTTDVTNGDCLGIFNWQGRATTGITAAIMGAYVEGTVTAGIVPARLEFNTVDASGGLHIPLILDSNGDTHLPLRTSSFSDTPKDHTGSGLAPVRYSTIGGVYKIHVYLSGAWRSATLT